MARSPKSQEGSERRIAIDEDTIRELTALLDELDLSEIEVEQDGLRVRDRKSVV